MSDDKTKDPAAQAKQMTAAEAAKRVKRTVTELVDSEDNQLSRSDIDGTNGFVAINGALPPGWPGGWKAIDNTYTPIPDIEAWKAFYASMFAAGNANFAHAQVLKAQLAAASTPAEVEAIQWGMGA